MCVRIKIMFKRIVFCVIYLLITNSLCNNAETISAELSPQPDLSDTSSAMIETMPNEELLVDCVVRNADNLTVLWKFARDLKSGDQKLLSANNVILSEDKRYSVLHNKDKDLWILQISRANVNDSGLYTCEVNSMPAVSVTRIVVVEYAKTENTVQSNYTKLISDNIAHNYTDCCMKEGVPPICYGYCDLKSLLGERPKANIYAICINFMPQLTKCLTDGRDHLPCCQRQNIPRMCHSSCSGRYSLTTALEHVTCVEYAMPTLACIAEGIQTLPPPPRDVTVEALSPNQLIVKWENNGKSSQSLIDRFELNVTELHSFDPNDWSLNTKKEAKLMKKDEIKIFPLKIKTFNITANNTEWTVNELKEATMYEIEMISLNDKGSSVSTNGIRVITLSAADSPPIDTKKPISVLGKNKTDSSLASAPNLRQCCLENGIKSERCLNTLCDPIQMEEASPVDISACIQYTNITFKCLATDIDNRGCCEERGVSQFCLHFCKDKNSKLDFRHLVCLHHIPAYSTCYLETKGLLASEPRSVVVPSIHTSWALLKWLPPTKLTETVTKYRIHLRELDIDGEDGYLADTATRSPYLIEGLRPGNSYEVFVTAINKYGPSRPSSRLLFTTKEPEPNEEIELQQSDASQGYNETACCERAQLPLMCLPLCNYHFKINDAINLGPLCADHRTIRITIRCMAGGRDHRPCCERRGVEDKCLDLCTGTLNDTPYIVGSKCSKYGGKVLQCMAEGADSLPGIPENFHATLVTSTGVHLQWNDSSDDLRSGARVSYQLSYSPISSEIPPHPYDDSYSIKINVSDTKYILDELKPSTRYSIYIVALNSYGYSLPSLVLLIETKSETDGEHVETVRAQLGPPHSVEVFHRTTESISFKWLPPAYMPVDASLSYEVNWRRLSTNTSDATPIQSNWTVFETRSNTIDLTALKFGTQYAIAVRAKTETGLRSAMSEILIASTEAATPLRLSSPALEPMGPIIEGSMMTVRCNATGSPIPTITVFINGVAVYREQTRHIRYRLDYVQRNLTSISCVAANEETDTDPNVMPVQSHIEVRVRFAPSIKVDRQLVVSPKYGSAQIRCEFSGNPPPKVQFYRDLRNQPEIRSGSNAQITVFPHSTKSSTWIATLQLNRVTESDAGNYLCIAQNQYGRETSVLTLRVEDYKVAERNTSECCAQQNVLTECRKACNFDIDFDYIFNNPQCFADLDKYMLCAADGSDHRDCCLRREVSRECLHWCAGFKVAKPSLCLLSSVRDIVSCFREGNSLLPSPPVNVHVSEAFADNRLLISWDKPEKNSEAVQWYSVYWKQVGAKQMDSDRTDQLEYELHDLNPDEVYEFLVKSSNYYGTSALSEPLVFDVRSAMHSEQHSLDDSMLKILLLSLLTIVVMVVIAVLGVYGFKRKELFLAKFRSTSAVNFGISFENHGYLNNADTLQMQDNINNNSAVNGVNGVNNSSDANNNQSNAPVVQIRMV